MIMDTQENSSLDLNLNLKVKSGAATGEESSTPEGNIASQTQNNPCSPYDNVAYSASPNSPLLGRRDIRATDLMMQVQVNADGYKYKIYDLALSASEELIQKACALEPLWKFDDDKETEVLNLAEYKRRFSSSLVSTLEEIINLIAVKEPAAELTPELSSNGNVTGEGGGDLPAVVENGQVSNFQTEASRARGIVPMHPLHVIDIFMDVEQWSLVFCNIVSKVTVLGLLSTGEELRNANGTLQVMKAELHAASPLVETREMYFARYCKQLAAANAWVVVDVSLESIIPNMLTRCRRKPSGCLVQGLENGFTKVTWVEHNEVENGFAPNMFGELISSGFAFSAKRWVSTLEMQCERLKIFMEESNIGRRAILQLSQRISRSYNEAVSASPENQWKPLPTSNPENIMVKTSFNVDDPGHPRGVILTVATSVRLPKAAKDVFDFLCSGTNRNKWDILSSGCATRDLVHFSTGREASNRVSIVLVEPQPNKTTKFYLQESYTDATGYYIVYAPIDDSALTETLKGGNSGRVAILGSGFTVFPERPIHQDDMATSGSMLTIVFQIADEHLSSPEYIPPQIVATLHNLIAGTVSMIEGSV